MKIPPVEARAAVLCSSELVTKEKGAPEIREVLVNGEPLT
jgi:hypothetical protein